MTNNTDDIVAAIISLILVAIIVGSIYLIRYLYKKPTKAKAVAKPEVMEIASIPQRQPKTSVGRILGAAADASVGIAESVVRATKVAGAALGDDGLVRYIKDVNTMTSMALDDAIQDMQTAKFENDIRNNERLTKLKDAYQIDDKTWNAIKAEADLSNFR